MSSTLHFQWTFSLGRRRNHARPGKRNFSCPRRESKSRPSKYVLTTEPTRALALVKSEFYYTSRVYYTSVLGAECTALLCSVSRVASSSFSKVIFNDALTKWTFSLGRRRSHARRGTKIFVAPGEHGLYSLKSVCDAGNFTSMTMVFPLT